MTYEEMKSKACVASSRSTVSYTHLFVLSALSKLGWAQVPPEGLIYPLP